MHPLVSIVLTMLATFACSMLILSRALTPPAPPDPESAEANEPTAWPSTWRLLSEMAAGCLLAVILLACIFLAAAL